MTARICQHFATITRTTDEAVEALSASCLPCELAAAVADTAPEIAEEDAAHWEGILTYEGQMTGDGRLIQTNALRWDNLPIPLRWSSEDNGGHAGAVVVGRITDIERRDDGAIFATGDFDLGSEAGREAARQVEKGLTPGVSVDLDDVAFEVRVASDAVDGFKGAEVELSEEPDENGRVKVAAGQPDDEVMITTDGRIRAATLVAIPAFESARISLAAGGWDESRHPRVPKGVPDIGGQFIDNPLDILDSLNGIRLNNGVKDDQLDNIRRQIQDAMDAGEPGDLEVNEKLYAAADALDELYDETDDVDYANPEFRQDISDAGQGLRDFASVDNWDEDEEEDTELNDELDAEEAGAAAADDPDRQPKSVGDLLPDAIKEIDKANPTESEALPEGLDDKALFREISELLKTDPSEALYRAEEELSPEDFQKFLKHHSDLLFGGPFDSDEELAAGTEKFNWVDDVGGLPQYIKRIAKHLKADGMAEGRAIATAVNAAKKMCATGDLNFPGKQEVNPGSRAEACAAVADWERKKAQANADAAEVVTAGAFPLQPPAEWFANPNLDGPTPLKVLPDGRVYGHLAVWGTCHTAYPGQCVTPPNSYSNYSYFRTGSVYASDGSEHSTGVITMDTLHAGKNLSAVSTLAHYEHTGRAVADVAVGEDAYGIWISGALRPGVTEEQARALRGSPLSGDWRKIGSSGLELVAALAVNVPGFPIPRPQGLVAGGSMVSLVASGMLAPELPTRKARRVARKALSEEDYAYLKRLADRERRMAEQEVEQMAREIEVDQLSKSIGI